MKSATILASLILGLVAGEARAGGNGARRFQGGEVEVGLGGRYFASDSNYSSSGSQQSLPASGTFNDLRMDLESRFTLTETWAISGGLEIGNAESNGADAVRSNSSLAGAHLGVEMKWGTTYVDFIPGLALYFPFEKFSPSQDAVMNSEGVSETRLSVDWQSEFEGFNLFGELGYTQRGGGRSALMPWGLGVEFLTSSFKFGSRLHGFQSASQDKDAGSSEGELARQGVSDRINAGSLKYYAINPSLVDLDVFVVFQLGRPWILELHGGLTLAGQNTAAGYHGGAVISYVFNSRPVPKARPFDPKRSVDPYLDQFEETIDDGVDQNLFRSRPKPAVRPNSSAPPRRRADPAAKESLDEMEMMIELKVDDRKKRRR